MPKVSRIKCCSGIGAGTPDAFVSFHQRILVATKSSPHIKRYLKPRPRQILDGPANAVADSSTSLTTSGCALERAFKRPRALIMSLLRELDIAFSQGDAKDRPADSEVRIEYLPVAVETTKRHWTKLNTRRPGHVRWWLMFGRRRNQFSNLPARSYMAVWGREAVIAFCNLRLKQPCAI